MHEFSIASGIARHVREFAAARGIERIIEVRIAIGELSCLEAEQLRFCFDAIVSDTPLRGCTLTIERVAAAVRCPKCQYRGAPKYWEDALAAAPFPTLECPECAGTVEIVEGRECMIRSVRCVSDEQPAANETLRA
jgi:hydrogenase nickel incorporation protein HypA/HybF